MARREVVELAGAIRRQIARHHARHAQHSREGVVLRVEPLLVDVLGEDAQADEFDVTIGGVLEGHLATEPLEVGDTLALVETSPGDYIAIDVLRDGEEG